MKKIIVAILLISSLILVSCGDKTKTETKDEGPQARVSTGVTGTSGMPSESNGER